MNGLQKPLMPSQIPVMMHDIRCSICSHVLYYTTSDIYGALSLPIVYLVPHPGSIKFCVHLMSSPHLQTSSFSRFRTSVSMPGLPPKCRPYFLTSACACEVRKHIPGKFPRFSALGSNRNTVVVSEIDSDGIV